MTDVKNPGVVSVADQGYPPVPKSFANQPTAVDVHAASVPTRPQRSRATYRPRTSEVRVDPQLRRRADEDFQVLGAAGPVSGRVEQGPAPIGSASPSCVEVSVVPLPDPAVPGHYAGPSAALDQRPAEQVRDVRVAGTDGALPPVSDVYLVPPNPSGVPGRYAGPVRNVELGLRPEHVEFLRPVVNVNVADQVIGRPRQSIEERS